METKIFGWIGLCGQCSVLGDTVRPCTAKCRFCWDGMSYINVVIEGQQQNHIVFCKCIISRYINIIYLFKLCGIKLNVINIIK